MGRYGSRKAQGNLNQSYFMASSPTPYLIHFNRKCHSHPLTLMVSQFRNTIQPKSNKAKKQFITSLINSLTLLSSQPQRLLYQEGKMHSQEGGKTTMVPVQAAKFLDKLRQNQNRAASEKKVVTASSSSYDSSNTCIGMKSASLGR